MLNWVSSSSSSLYLLPVLCPWPFGPPTYAATVPCAKQALLSINLEIAQRGLPILASARVLGAWLERLAACSTWPARPWPPNSIDLACARCPELLQVSKIDRQEHVFVNFRSMLSPIFVDLRGGIARATRLAERSAYPSFLLAGAVLWRVRWPCGKLEHG